MELLTETQIPRKGLKSSPDVALLLAKNGDSGLAVLHIFDGGLFDRTITGRAETLKAQAEKEFPDVRIEEVHQ